jgi:ubiquinone/menaquinone biosynthesis C-methylase UbiE
MSHTGAVAGAVFDRLAPTYDQLFTGSHIGRAQRSAVWQHALKTFRTGDHLLELNCGTGEDALFLASHGISVLACDASQQMIHRAETRLEDSPPSAPVAFRHLATEDIAALTPTQFDGAFSNFSGLNCVQDLAGVASSLSALVKDGGSLLFCFSTRICLTEIAYYLLHGQTAKAFRRTKGSSTAVLDGTPLTVYYPTVNAIRRAFAPHFRLRSTTGIGVAIPPSYLEPWARRHPHIFQLLCRLERPLSAIPFLRTSGDHVLLRFEKVTP